MTTLEAIVQWLREQHDKDGISPHCDTKNPKEAILDGYFDLTDLAARIESHHLPVVTTRTPGRSRSE